MAGIYVHIPFCKRKCHYCDFYSTTNSELIDKFIFALKEEIALRDNYLGGERITSIYFGGGSPSMLSVDQIGSVLCSIKNHFEISSSVEITFECNPDDVDLSFFEGIKEVGINRLSIGIQSFDDKILRFLNRRHDSIGGEDAINCAKAAGFNNISIDLMFGIPGMTNEVYDHMLTKAIDFKVNHISAYHLSIEPQTVLFNKLKKGIINVVDEDLSLFQFDLTIEKLKESGYKHYEVSNYALDGYESEHNWLYWSNGKYLGLGPSAHSYDGNSRQWNINNTRKYIDAVACGFEYFTKENLSEADKFNEYILTSLRTSKGVSEEYIKNEFNDKILKHFSETMHIVVNEGYIEDNFDRGHVLNKKGYFILDLIVRKFYYI